MNEVQGHDHTRSMTCACTDCSVYSSISWDISPWHLGSHTVCAWPRNSQVRERICCPQMMRTFGIKFEFHCDRNIQKQFDTVHRGFVPIWFSLSFCVEPLSSEPGLSWNHQLDNVVIVWLVAIHHVIAWSLAALCSNARKVCEPRSQSAIFKEIDE